MVQNYISSSEEDTKKFANEFANKLRKGSIVVLTGELGSGKTKFAEGILAHFGLANEISSPTFTIVNEHHNNATSIYHFDVYRLEDADEFYAMGGEDYFDKGICLIEWGEKIEDILPKGYYKVTFHKSSEDPEERILQVERKK